MSLDVVIVDDAAEVRRMLRTALRFRPRFATAGEAATAADGLALVRRLRPHIVILDLGLPDLSGEHLVNRIREASPTSKIVIFSGSEADADAPVWFADRSAAYVPKDQLDRLIDTLESLTTPPPSVTSHLTLPAAPASVALVREHVRRQTAAWSVPQLTDDAVVIASELAANALEHARTGFDVRLELREGQVLRIEVTDHGTGNPEPQVPSIESERGRGLFIVSVLAGSWGIQPSPDDGKVVWAEIVDPLTDDQPGADVRD